MYYIIQKNIFKDPRYDEIFKVLDYLELEYEQVEFIPHTNEFEYKTKRKDIFVYGSVKLARVTANYDWHPGSFYGLNHEYEAYTQGYGNNVINYGSYLCKITDEIDWTENPTLFIKPSRDAKVFTGKVFDKKQWDDLVYESLHDSSDSSINEHTEIQISAPYYLIKEARIWIVGKTVITSSYYKFHGNAEFEDKVSQDGLEFAQAMANLHNIADAYVMDIGLTLDGWKIVEINCINSAGFYNADLYKLTVALEVYYQDV